MTLNQQWRERLRLQRKNGLWRERLTVTGRSGAEVRVDDKTLCCFASNDTLNLSTAPSVIQAFQEALTHYGAGSGASPAVSGYSAEQNALETELAECFDFENACIFSSGYLANLAVIDTLFDDQTFVYMDHDCHASLLDACRLAKVKLHRFRHNDMKHLCLLLSKHPQSAAQPVIITEGVFSTQGDCAPLP